MPQEDQQAGAVDSVVRVGVATNPASAGSDPMWPLNARPPPESY